MIIILLLLLLLIIYLRDVLNDGNVIDNTVSIIFQYGILLIFFWC